MKKITNVEVSLINLNASDVIATSAPGFSAQSVDASAALVGARGYYDDEEEDIW